MRWVRTLVVVLLLGACARSAGTWTNESGAVVPQGAAPAAGDAAPAVRHRAARPVAEDASQADEAADEAADVDSREPSCASPPPPSPPRSVVTGKVTDESGAPIADAHVLVVLDAHSSVGDRTGDDGRFAIDFRAESGVARVLAWADGRAVDAGQWFAAPANSAIGLGDIALRPEAELAGRVQGPGGEEITGGTCVRIDGGAAFGAETWAFVARWMDWDGSVAFGGTDDAPASFAFRHLPPGPYVLEADEFERTGSPVSVTAPAPDVVLPVSAAPPEPTIDFYANVLVTDAEGRPCAFRTLGFRDAVTGESLRTGVCRLDRGAGTAELHGQIVAWPVDLTVEFREGDRATVRLGAAPEIDVVVRRDPRFGRFEIRGTVTAGGAPLTWRKTPPRGSRGCYGGIVGTPTDVCVVRADGAGPRYSVPTDEDGSFVVTGLEDADYEVWARASGFDLAPATVRVHAGSTVRIDLPAAGSRRFEVRGPEGAGLERIESVVESLDDDADSATTDDGWESVVATVLRPGAAYRLRVRGQVGRTWTAWTTVEGWTADDAPIAVQLAPGLAIRGRVVRADGSPVVGASVDVRPEVGDDDTDLDDESTTSGLDGSFVVTGLGPGAWRVTAWAPGLTSEDRPVVVAAGADGVLVYVVPPEETDDASCSPGR